MKTLKLGLALVLLIMLGSLARQETEAAPEPAFQDPPQPWERAVELIETAKAAGRVSLDQAAVYRFYALTEPEQLPAEFALPEKGLGATSVLGPNRDAMLDLALRFKALLTDRESWSPETRRFIAEQLAAGDRANQSLLTSLAEQVTTEHFLVHYDSVVTDETEALALSQNLETAYSALASASYDYRMPDPADFGGRVRFDVFIVPDPIRICLLPISASQAVGLTLPGQMWFNSGYAENAPLAAHEFYHMLQWNYLGMRSSDCGSYAVYYLWYIERGRWLMEGTSSWFQHDLYPSDGGYSSYLDPFLDMTDTSLFATTETLREYGTALFFKFVQMEYRPASGSSRDLIRSIWEETTAVSPDPIDAVTHVLLASPPWDGSYADYRDLWHHLMADFAVANYLEDYPDWPSGKTVRVGQVLHPVAQPPGVQTHHLDTSFLFTDPSSRYIEVVPDSLGLPAGSDQTGASLQLEFSSDCPGCSLDVLQFDSAGHSTRSQHLITHGGGGDYQFNGTISDSFGSPVGIHKVALVLSNGAGANGTWGLHRNAPFLPEEFTYYDFSISAIDNPPQAPRNLSAVADVSSDAIQLNWDPVHEDGIIYRIYRSETTPVPVDISHALVIPLSNQYADHAVEPGVRYYYVVVSIDLGGNTSGPSNEVSARLPPLPPSPTPTDTPTPTSTPNVQGYFLTGPFSFTLSTHGAQQYAYHVVSQVQPGQTAFAGIVIYSDYGYNSFHDAHALGYDPSLHGASSNWDQRAGWYCRTSNWSQDSGACTFASGVLGHSLNLPRPLSYWNRAGWPGSTVFSAFRIESFPCCTWPPVTAHFTVYYIWHSYAPTPTPVSSPTPSSTPAPCPCPLLWLTGGCSSGSASRLSSLLAPMRSLQQAAIDLPLFYRVRDEVLSQSAAGQRLIDLYDQHGLETSSLLQQDSVLRDEALAALDLWEPNLQALVDGQGGTAEITQAQVDAVQSFLDHLSAEANPGLQEALAAEEERWPLSAFPGMTMSEAWETISGNVLYLPYVTR